MKNSLPPMDEAVRKEALNPEGSFIVQAPAGSGKTELLTQRYLTLLARVDQPEEVLAITFTRKAAAEMRNRVLSAIESADAPTPIDDTPHKRFTRELGRAVLERSRERGWDLLRTPGRLRVQTIDSFCASTVSQRPMQTGFGAAADVAEENQGRTQLYRQAALNTIKSMLVPAHDKSAAMKRALVHLDNNVALVIELVSEMLQRRDQWERYVSGQNQTGLRQQFEDVLKRIVEGALRHLRECVPQRLGAEIAALLAIAERNLSEEGRDNRLLALHGMTALPSCTGESLEQWRAVQWFLQTQKGTWRVKPNITIGFPTSAREAKKRCEDLLNELQAEGYEDFRDALESLGQLPATKFEDSQWEVLEALLAILPLAIAELKKLFRESAATDFIEISQGALTALESSKSHALQHLLVDEFQDTSVMQWRIFNALVGGWEPDDGHTVFLVGDPMQSIYRFRQAEVGLFLQARQQGFGKLKPKPLSLQVNFRSDVALVDWFNARFESVFGDADDSSRGLVSFNRCFAGPGKRTGAEPQMHWATDAEDEAAKTVATVRDALKEDGSIAILVRARTHLPAIIEALQTAEIQFEAIEIQKLGERAVIRDLLMLTRALLHPADRLAWIAVLRAPWCGMTLNDLHALCGHDQKSAIWDCISGDISAVSEDGRARLERTRAVLSAAIQQRLRVPLRQWVEGTWIALGGPACLSDAADLENAESFFELLEAADQTGGLNPEDLVAAFDGLFAKSQTGGDVRVQVMTIHKAKGLEFDTVIVPGLARGARNDNSRLLLWEERTTESRTELLLAPITQKGAEEKDPIYRYLQKAEAARKTEEDKRLLYVAVTRAKRALHLVAAPKLRKKDNELSGSGSLLQFLWPDLKRNLQGSEDEERLLAAQEERDNLTIAAAEEHVPMMLRRLPVDWRLPDAPEPLRWAAEDVRTPVPDGERITYDWVSERLRHIGTVVHAMTQRIARDGLKCWPAERIRQSNSLYKAALAERGLGQAEVDQAAADVEQALLGLVADERGRWTLDAHEKAQSEYALSGVLNGNRVEHFKLDRTFVDEDGTRWIIDYKTARHEGSDREGFLDNEKIRYKDQLDDYARLFHRLQPDHPIRVGLYFPLLRGWREWEPEIG